MGYRSLLYIGLGVLLAVGTMAVVGPQGPIDVEVSVDGMAQSTDSAQEPRSTESTGSYDATATATAKSDGGFFAQSVDTRKIAFAIHAEINAIRAERGLSRLKMSPKLREAALLHSKDMAQKGYFSHTSPSGEDFEDRYQQVGYNCRVDKGAGESYSVGAENIAQTWAFGEFYKDSGEVVSYSGNETQIAKGIVSQWMNSRGHRENILKPYWSYEGIGVATVEVEDGTKVYATQNFC